MRPGALQISTDRHQLLALRSAERNQGGDLPFKLCEEGIERPVKSRQGEAHGVVWRLPAYNIVHNI
jgi:hypothetical protein